ncbi:MAG TPA: ROK family protein [Candidatus Hydrogenedentes bacterium]|nr:ROK family protein [Candidatus Hydrogenedentota bacterium]HOL78024.1 ROK family protein [Candidatus Hydrogenedentota bacterium]HPO84617.1 ROK family protein [Candidatus Hydrogenedentota bacterium]
MKDVLKDDEHVVGLDIGGTKMMAVVYNGKWQDLGRCKKKSKFSKEEPAEARIIRVVSEAIEAAGNVPIKGIGVGSPGPLDPVSGIVIDTPNLGWKNFPLAKILSDRFKVPVIVDNDVNVGTYGEWCFGVLKDCAHVVGIFPGTGIGGGIIIDKKLLHGFSGAAGEVGHMTIQEDGPFCGCGKRGCLEALASRIAIAKEVAALAARGDAPYVAANCGTDLRNIRSNVLAQAIKAGDTLVEEVVRKAAYYVGIAVGNLINILSPEAVVLGGGLVEAMESLYLEEVKRAVKVHAMPFLRKGVRIEAARLGDDAVVRGAARMIAEHLSVKKK